MTAMKILSQNLPRLAPQLRRIPAAPILVDTIETHPAKWSGTLTETGAAFEGSSRKKAEDKKRLAKPELPEFKPLEAGAPLSLRLNVAVVMHAFDLGDQQHKFALIENSKEKRLYKDPETGVKYTTACIPAGKVDEEDFSVAGMEEGPRYDPSTDLRLTLAADTPERNLSNALLVAAAREACSETGLYDRTGATLMAELRVGTATIAHLSRRELAMPEFTYHTDLTPYIEIDLGAFEQLPELCGQNNDDSRQAGWVSAAQLRAVGASDRLSLNDKQLAWPLFSNRKLVETVLARLP